MSVPLASTIDLKAAPYGALLLRVSLGGLLLAHAGLKYFVFTPAGTEGFFASLGLPGWFGLVVMAGEVICGLALVLGVYVRLAAVLMAADLLGAVFLVHIHNGFFFTAKGGGWEYPAFWAVALIVQALLGGGALAMYPDFKKA
ncbi:MAG: LysR family transcriptional regulator [Acidocella sp. 20-57-95]|nr:MAG: LysR family transcriptional regulator [Acidocella sp. 20-57-95]OYV58930.1 MAG: LysR family transcriptional regulator [Acidocella sp. 21-58-7]HQT65264.1 DoxX family protein [Acidocella sp.]HQU05048.1 DoxX family protein [Acidocella sp.]